MIKGKIIRDFLNISLLILLIHLLLMRRLLKLNKHFGWLKIIYLIIFVMLQFGFILKGIYFLLLEFKINFKKLIFFYNIKIYLTFYIYL